MNHSIESDNIDVERTIGPLPTNKTSSPSVANSGSTAAMPLPEFPNSSNISNDACSENDEFDTSFMANNNHTVRRVSFLRSPTPASLNTTNASRGVSVLVAFVLFSEKIQVSFDQISALYVYYELSSLCEGYPCLPGSFYPKTKQMYAFIILSDSPRFIYKLVLLCRFFTKYLL